MDLKIGDVIRVRGEYDAVITKIPDGSLDNQYSFLYADGVVDEEAIDFFIENTKVIGHINGVEALLAKIAEFSNE